MYFDIGYIVTYYFAISDTTVGWNIFSENKNGIYCIIIY